ncbi:Isochorismatase-like protein [Spinellus fusiger]|nr:Isochorismatase-like protein [Spinellus fusiger]
MLFRKMYQLSTSTTALFICDIQKKFEGLIWQFPSVVTVANKMIKASNILDIPIVVTEQYPKAFGNTASELDILGAALVVEKKKFSMYIPPVAELMKKRNTKSVLLVGLESHVCVLQTALELLKNEVDVYVIVDGVSSQNSSEINIALGCMKAAGATITTSESILFQLVQDAGHPNFKSISALVKEYAEVNKVNKLLQRASFSSSL